jgi:hypothetical protein
MRLEVAIGVTLTLGIALLGVLRLARTLRRRAERARRRRKFAVRGAYKILHVSDKLAHGIEIPAEMCQARAAIRVYYRLEGWTTSNEIANSEGRVEPRLLYTRNFDDVVARHWPPRVPPAARLVESLADLLPTRINDEQIGDAIEERQRRLERGQSSWRVSLWFSAQVAWAFYAALKGNLGVRKRGD